MKRLSLIISLVLLSFGMSMQAQVPGCTDPLAINYNPSATVNDGSCLYPSATVTPSASADLSPTLSETSGLAAWNGYLWTHNDNTDTRLYALDTLSGNIVQSCQLTGVENTDWEEISQDEDYLYVGDFGNNANGNRTDLNILKISKESIIQGVPSIETIHFAYSDQFNFAPTGSNNTNYDCEAMIVTSDSIYLFTKRWLDQKTSLYALPKQAGTYTASFRAIFNVEGLITGANLQEAQRIVVLSGYSSMLQPFLYLLYDYPGKNYFSGNKRKISIGMSFHQVEGVASTNGLKYYISNEAFSQPPVVNVSQGLHVLDLSPYLGYYLQHLSTGVFQPDHAGSFRIRTNLSSDRLLIVADEMYIGKEFRMIDATGKAKIRGKIQAGQTSVSLKNLPSGIYILAVYSERIEVRKIIRP